jgi:predicted transcriptional regulator of viral defense system
MTELRTILNDNKGYVNAGSLSSQAELKRVQRAAEDGMLLRLKRGVYVEPSEMLSNMIDVESIVPEGVICLYNAWAYYQLTTMVPPAFCVAISAKRKIVVPDITHIQLYYWKAENLGFGITEADISGFHVRITDQERSVCDAVKYRNKVGKEICSEVIRSYLRKKERNLSRLMEYAEKLRVKTTLQKYLEIAIG